MKSFIYFLCMFSSDPDAGGASGHFRGDSGGEAGEDAAAHRVLPPVSPAQPGWGRPPPRPLPGTPHFHLKGLEVYFDPLCLLHSVFQFSHSLFQTRSAAHSNLTHHIVLMNEAEYFLTAALICSLFIMSPHHLSSSRRPPPLTLLLFHLLPLSRILSAASCRGSQNSSIELCALIHQAQQY